MSTLDTSAGRVPAAGRDAQAGPIRVMRHTVAFLVAGVCCGGLAAGEPRTSISDLKRMSVEDLMNIEVTSVGRRPERLGDAPAAVQVITREQLRSSGATTFGEALRLAHSLQVAQRDSHGWAVSARGFNTELANKLLVLVDGRTVYTPLFSGVYWEAQGYLLEDVERIEVISGPGGTLWGANAVNGVISIITRRAAETQGWFATVAAGGELDLLAAARYGTELAPGVHLRVFGKHVAQDESIRASGAPGGDAWERGQAGFRLDAGSTASAFTLQGDFHDSTLEDPQVAGERTILRGANLLGRWTRSQQNDGELSLQAYVDWSRYDDAVPDLVLDGNFLAAGGRFRDDLLTFDVDFQHRFRPHRAHTLTWGAGFRHMRDDLDNAPAQAVLPARLDQQLYSLFVQDEIALHERFTLTLGTKLEHHDYTGFELQPSARLQWHPSDLHMIWGAVSRAVRIPSRLDRELFQAAPPGFPLLYGNPDFESERLIAYELGHRARIGSRVSTSLSLYLNDYEDVRTVTVTPEVLLPFRFANDLAGRTWGLEFSGTMQLTSQWSVRAGYNLMEQRLKVREGRVDISNGRNETADPEQQVSVGTAVTLPWGLELDAGLRWVDVLHVSDGPAVGTVPDYLEMEARLAWHATRNLEVALVGRDLLHRRHAEYGFPGPDRALIERSVYGRLTWRH